VGPDLGLVPFALIAALSPVAFAAALAVIHAGRVQALLFGTTFVVTQFLVCAFLVLLGGWSLPSRGHEHPTFRAVVEILFGLWVVALAFTVRRRPRPPSAPHGRMKGALERLGSVNVWTALAAGVALGIGGPKRLVVTALAAATIADSAGGDATQAASVALYTAVATVLVWAPVLVFALAGSGAVDEITRAAAWVARHGQTLMVLALLAVGAFAIVDGVVTLL
jgi:hypothetical protein